MMEAEAHVGQVCSSAMCEVGNSEAVEIEREEKVPQAEAQAEVVKKVGSGRHRQQPCPGRKEGDEVEGRCWCGGGKQPPGSEAGDV